MGRGAAKSEFNACQICVKPRAKGANEFSHGKCAEIRAATEGKKIATTFVRGGEVVNISVEQHEKGLRNANTKKYLNGRLPKWMCS